jgi:DNA repair exonuclease SbcCD ATPase subunit
MAYDDEGNFIEESDDDDILKDLFIDGDNNDGGGNDLDPEELKSLKDALAEKDKQINGLLQTVKADRRKRQETKGQLDQLTSTVNSILAQREELNQQLDDGSRSGSSKGTINGIPVEFNDDGDAFVPQDKLEALTSKYEEKIQELEQSLLLTNQNQQQTAQAQAAVQQMVGEDERYAPVYSKYQNARKWVNDRVIDFQTENNINGAFTSGQALTHVFDENPALQDEFAKRYPDFDLAQVATAEDSPYHFKTMLKSTAGKLGSLKQPDERFRKVMSKPSGLGKSTNAKGGELSLAERVASLSATDIMKLSDDQLEALQKFMADDEQRDGIKF